MLKIAFMSRIIWKSLYLTLPIGELFFDLLTHSKRNAKRRWPLSVGGLGVQLNELVPEGYEELRGTRYVKIDIPLFSLQIWPLHALLSVT